MSDEGTWSPQGRQQGKEGGCDVEESKNKWELTTMSSADKDGLKLESVLIASDLDGVVSYRSLVP